MLSADEARQLERLALGSSSPAAVASSGLRHASARGFGLEFHDFRHYQPGDDPRSIDWNVEARLRQLVVRVFRAEGQLQLHLLVDVSRSMTTGTPQKIECARKLAAALCYVAVERRDAVGLATFDETIRSYVKPAAGRSQIFRVFDTLRTPQQGSRSAINRALLDYGGAVRGPGLAVVLSDFYHPDGALDGLRYLLHRGLTPAIVQIVSDEELQPDIVDEAELVDVEDASGAPLVVDAAAVAAYQDRLAQMSAELEAFCLSRSLPWLRVASSTSFQSLVKACQQAGLLTRRA